jgi:hypothetical protein
MKLPYGGLDTTEEYERIHGVKEIYRGNQEALDPWDRLFEIQRALYQAERLEDGRLTINLPSELAVWLGSAVEYSARDRQEFLLRLGLQVAKGKPGKTFSPWAMAFGKRIEEIEEEKDCSTDKAVGLFIEELQNAYECLYDGHPDMPSPSTLKRYRRIYAEVANTKTG